MRRTNGGSSITHSHSLVHSRTKRRVVSSVLVLLCSSGSSSSATYTPTDMVLPFLLYSCYCSFIRFMSFVLEWSKRNELGRSLAWLIFPSFLPMGFFKSEEEEAFLHPFLPTCSEGRLDVCRLSIFGLVRAQAAQWAPLGMDILTEVSRSCPGSTGVGRGVADWAAVLRK